VIMNLAEKPAASPITLIRLPQIQCHFHQ